MTKEPNWIPSARKRLIEQGTTPANIEALEDKAVAEAVARILGNKPAEITPGAEAAEPELTKQQQRRTAEKKAERDRRFGRA